ncbi:Uncharacterised protein at_DN0243 [Pycnogonum litorale]
MVFIHNLQKGCFSSAFFLKDVCSYTDLQLEENHWQPEMFDNVQQSFPISRKIFLSSILCDFFPGFRKFSLFPTKYSSYLWVLQKYLTSQKLRNLQPSRCRLSMANMSQF